MRINSTAGEITAADQKDLNPSIGRVLLEGPVILLNDLVELFDLAHLDAGLGLGVVTSIAAVLAPLLSIVIFSGVPLCLIALCKKRSAAFAISFGGQQEIYRSACLVDRPVQIFPDALDLHVGLVQPPTGSYRTLARTKLLLQQRHVLDHPTIERGMVNLDATLTDRKCLRRSSH